MAQLKKSNPNLNIDNGIFFTDYVNDVTEEDLVDSENSFQRDL